MGFEDLTKKATDFLNTDQGEQISDKVLDGAADLAKKVSDGKFGDQIDGARDAADGAIGNNG
ncbi:antitoxin [Longispora sp. K20-0274]|uniref:antitoxin n=1 Tax=Longispora sp. K20-0274 TaxID=3088255 RepID=UPI003999A62A